MENNNFSESEAIKNISNYSNEKLADIIITHRYFGLYENLSIAAMKELATRRTNGDKFEYEKYIEENLKSLPQFKLQKFSMKDAFATLKNMFKR